MDALFIYWYLINWVEAIRHHSKVCVDCEALSKHWPPPNFFYNESWPTIKILPIALRPRDLDNAMVHNSPVFMFIQFTYTCFPFPASQNCITPLGVSSDCISLYDCPPLISAFESRPLPGHVINFLRESQCGFEGYTPRVCCGPLPSQPVVQTTVSTKIVIVASFLITWPL